MPFMGVADVVVKQHDVEHEYRFVVRRLACGTPPRVDARECGEVGCWSGVGRPGSPEGLAEQVEHGPPGVVGAG